MIPPTSIDGTDITGATIDGTDVQEITVDGQTVFTAEKIIDDFESNNLTNYSAETSQFEIISGADAIDGSFSLQSKNADFDADGIYSDSGLSNYPQRGDTFEFKIETVGNNNVNAGMIFGVQSNENDNYMFNVTPNDFRIRKDQEITSNNRTFQNITGGSGWGNPQPYTCKIEWGTTTISSEWFDANGNLLHTNSLNDTDYDTGGIGWWVNRFTGNSPQADAAKWDSAIIL